MKVDAQNKGVGERPCWEGVTEYSPDLKSRHIVALNWANVVLSEQELGEELKKYIQENTEYDSSIPEELESWRWSSAAKTAWLFNDGAPIQSSSFTYLNEQLQSLHEFVQNKKAQKQNSDLKEEPKRSAKQIDNINAVKCWNDLSELLEDETFLAEEPVLDTDKQAVKRILDRYNLKKKGIEYVLKNLKELYTEYQNITRDPELRECYSHLSKHEVQRRQKWISSVQRTVENEITNKSQRKKRNSKNSEERAVQGLNYKAEDAELNIRSIDPVKILGAKAVLVYNTKQRKIELKQAATPEGLGVKGTTLTNMDEEKSAGKRVKKPEEQLPEFRNANFKRVSVLINERMPGKTLGVSPRINGECVLLKVF